MLFIPNMKHEMTQFEKYKNSLILSRNWKMQEAQNGISLLDVEVNSDLHLLTSQSEKLEETKHEMTFLKTFKKWTILQSPNLKLKCKNWNIFWWWNIICIQDINDNRDFNFFFKFLKTPELLYNGNVGIGKWQLFRIRWCLTLIGNRHGNENIFEDT